MEQDIMQTDMHYYATYAMARAAGLTISTCQKIAYSAQFVDDNSGHQQLDLFDKAQLHFKKAENHGTNNRNLEPEEQGLVKGEAPTLASGAKDTDVEKLTWEKNNEIAKQMFEHYLSLPENNYNPYLIGVAAHIYAGSFSYDDSAGISQQDNNKTGVAFECNDKSTDDFKSYIAQKWRAFKTKLEVNSAERFSNKLGNNADHVYKNRPFLTWQFEYQSGGKDNWGNNPQTFIQACEHLYTRFKLFAANNPELTNAVSGIAFEEIRSVISDILNTKGDINKRINKWQECAKNGSLFGLPQNIPEYNKEEWLTQLDRLSKIESSEGIINLDISKFLQAAAIHRTYVLQELLPEHGLQIRSYS